MADEDPLKAAMVDAIAARTLAESADPGTRIGVAELARRAASRETFAETRVVPIGALALYRRLRAITAHVSSPTAFAAASAEGQRRIVDGIEIRVAVDDDAVWLILTLPEGIAPEALELVGEDGTLVRLPLTSPVDGIVQFGLSRTAPQEADAARLIESPTTHIFLI
ncbi:hypothetical protein L1787_03080 [Acuticoccus sp. M5D2P5]|uniref:hypothetical protein n=1 Tax=Acuticoccus kalidii TaxID=2910977 RepID=UPI001F49206B|nr:hypothetical protein [Acuticoccus kalidii]MCF3932398.1 hypothetical protein [Acuticoccus kalidii]